MRLTNAPDKIVLPFAADGDKTTIPVDSQIPITPGAASYHDGFPVLTSTPVSGGGVPPTRLDFNGILNETSAVDRWMCAGAGFPFDAAFVTAVGGYPKGSRVLRADGKGYWQSTVDDNTSNPDTGGAGWLITGAPPVASVFANTQRTVNAPANKVLFDTVEFDTNGLWDVGNNRFSAVYPGIYRFSGSIIVEAAPGQQYGVQVWKNGAAFKQGAQFPQVADGLNLSFTFDMMANAAAGDYFEVYMYMGGGNNIQVGISGGADNSAYVYAQAEFLGQQ